jgi:hypothetical protein
MITITTLETKQLTQDYITVSWVVMSTVENLSDYRFYIWRSNMPSPNLSDYELLTSSGVNPMVTSYYDTTVAGVTSKVVDYFYRVQISGITSHDSSFTPDYEIRVIVDKYAREIARRRDIVFSKHSSQPFFLLKRKSSGSYCSDCYDATLQRSTFSKCLTCYDTGITGGFFGPIDLIGQLMERPVQSRLTLFGDWTDGDSVLYCPALPPLNPKDVIIDRLSRRWIVLNVGSYSKASNTIGQIAQLRALEREDIAYRFPVTY